MPMAGFPVQSAAEAIVDKTTTDSNARRDLEKHREELAKFESSFEFDPTGRRHDLGELEAILAN